MGCRESLKQFKRRHMRDWMYQVDLYGFTPIPKFAGEKQYSIRGVFGSFITLIITIGYMVYTTVRFLQEAPTVSTTLLPTTSDPIEFLPSAITFRVPNATLGNGVLVPFYDERYFVFNVTQTTVFHQDLQPRVTIVLGSKPCDVSAWAGMSGVGAHCPVRVGLLHGRYNSPEYNFLRFDLVKCSGTTLDGRPCASDSEIATVLQTGRLNMLLHPDHADGDTARAPAVEAYNFFPHGDDHSLYEVTLQRKMIELLPNLVWRFMSSSTVTLQPGSVTYHQRSRSGRALTTVFFRLSATQSTESWAVQTVLDLFGQWFALYGSIAAVFGLYLLRYNEGRFYAKCPRWDRIDSEFRHMPPGENNDDDDDDSNNKGYTPPVDGVTAQGEGGGAGGAHHEDEELADVPVARLCIKEPAPLPVPSAPASDNGSPTRPLLIPHPDDV